MVCQTADKAGRGVEREDGSDGGTAAKIDLRLRLASRRRAEEWITAGRVTVNGEKAHLGDRADLDRDEILVDGRPLRPAGEQVYLMLHKPGAM